MCDRRRTRDLLEKRLSTSDLSPILEKMRFAERLVNDLADDMAPWLLDNAILDINEIQDRVFIVDGYLKETPPAEFSTRFGVCAHLLRSCLDWLVCALAVRHSGNYAYSAFPIFKNEAAFLSKADAYLHLLSPRDRRAIKALSPYKEGNDPLWNLHKVDIIDKHHTILIGAISATPIFRHNFVRSCIWDDSLLDFNPKRLGHIIIDGEFQLRRRMIFACPDTNPDQQGLIVFLRASLAIVTSIVDRFS